MKTKGSGLLGKWKSVKCPTCQAPADAYCVTLGQRGTVKGKEMLTAVHNARKALATGGEVVGGKVYKFKPTRKVTIASLRAPTAKVEKNKKVGRPSRRSLAAKAAWVTRRSHAGLKRLMTTPSVLEHFEQPHIKIPLAITLETLVAKTLEILSCGATGVTLNLDGIGKVHGSVTSEPNTYSLIVTKP